MPNESKPGIQYPNIENSDQSVGAAFKNVYDNLFYLLNRLAALGPSMPRERQSIAVIPRTIHKIGPPTTATEWRIPTDMGRNVIVQIRDYPDGNIIGPAGSPSAKVLANGVVEIDSVIALSPNTIEVIIQG